MYECFVVKAVFVYSNVSVFSVMWLELLIMLEISQCNDQCMSTHTSNIFIWLGTISTCDLTALFFSACSFSISHSTMM